MVNVWQHVPAPVSSENETDDDGGLTFWPEPLHCDGLVENTGGTDTVPVIGLPQVNVEFMADHTEYVE